MDPSEQISSSEDEIEFEGEDSVINVLEYNARTNYVDDNNSSSSSEESPQLEKPGLYTFDTGLPCQHSYLGNDLEILRGRTLLDDESYYTLDIYPAGLVLVPGQTLPLTIFNPRFVNMFQRCIKKDRTFGVIYRWDANMRDLDIVGTTAEIYEYQTEERPPGFRIKAKGRQRFKIIKVHNYTNEISATVKILPEVVLPDVLESVKFISLDRHRTANNLRCRQRDAVLTSWPDWVYKQYDIKRLITVIKEKLTFLVQGKQTSGIKIQMPDDPTELSFWVATNIPLSANQVMKLLRMNCPFQRLHWELSALQKVQILCCNRCLNEIGSHKDAFSMSVEGPQGTYVNPGGYLHETLTLFEVRNVRAVGPASTEFSWFPGYAWSIAECQQCHRHIGWKFIATKKNLMPKEFWGLSRGSITVQFNIASYFAIGTN